MIANERLRFNSLYLKELDVIVILHNEAKVNASLSNTTSRKLVYIICHGPETSFSLKSPPSITTIVDKSERV